jgi:predicted nucleic acid-binding protein
VLACPPPIAVLDTNVVLDWLLFRNAGCAALVASVESGQVRWCATASMREELARVLSRGHLAAWTPDPDAVWAQWERWCCEVAPHAPPDPTRVPRCTDPDDQPFVDLALGIQARWLVSRDRAVLALGRRLRPMGVRALVPEGWPGFDG